MTDHEPQRQFSPGGWLRAPEPDAGVPEADRLVLVSHLPASCLTTRQLVARAGRRRTAQRGLDAMQGAPR